MTFFGSGPGEDPWKRRGEDDARIATATLPAAVPLPWPLATAPAGYLLCNGAVIPAGCPQLTAAYGANLPDLRGVTIVGYDASQAEFNTLLGTGGAKTVALSEAQLAAHDHDDAGHTHYHGHVVADHNVTTSIQDHNHAHGIAFPAVEDSGPDAGGTNRWRGAVGSGATYPLPATAGVDTNHAHTFSAGHGVLADATSSVADIGDAGSGQAHNNLQPYRVFNYIVRAA